MCGARAFFALNNSLLAVIGGAALVACGVVSTEQVWERAQTMPVPAGWLVLAPYIAGPLLVLLSLLGVSALLAAAPCTARALLALYSACCVAAAAGAGGAAGWAGYSLASFLRDDVSGEATDLLRRDATLRAWVKPLLPVLAGGKSFGLPEEGIRAEVVSVMAVCGWTLLTLLLQSVLAVLARPPRGPPRNKSPLRRSSSVYYEPSAPPPVAFPRASAASKVYEDPRAYH